MHGGWLSALLQLLGMGGGPPAAPSTPPGGTFRRALPTWTRHFFRAAPTLRRVFSRERKSLQRIWVYEPMALPTESGVALVAAAGDDREYAFDLSKAPELATGTGITISSGAISGGSGLTFGAVSVLDAAFDGIASGKGVKVRISGGTAGTTYTFAVLVTLSNSRVIVVPARMSKVANYE